MTTSSSRPVDAPVSPSLVACPIRRTGIPRVGEHLRWIGTRLPLSAATMLALAVTVAPGALASDPSAPTPVAPALPSASPSPAAASLILRIESVGGLRPPVLSLIAAPAVSVYADGTVVAGEPGGEGEVGPRLIRAALSPGGVTAVLALVREVGADTTGGECGSVSGADMPSIRLTLASAASPRTIDLHDLERGGPCRTLVDLVERLADPRTWLEEMGASTPVPYVGERVRVVLAEADPSTPGALDWPWPDLGLEDFAPVPGVPALRAGWLPLDQATQLADPPYAWASDVRDPDGTIRSLWMRPLLPDEVVDPVPPSSAPSDQP